ncbi:GIDE domain-containing protein [Nocardiopsis ansamitocini]|uniref:RING-type E3 ubiquitin transferase n=1 Tax=Nocardiopsis ansamitocini TaxID=1670832 RepID=A0A9W6UIL4_9ACTN|nr:GIDE domain-containing protein [Nocardiopsis ansamitocini]GLU47822.1 hypothetical protein Nans01_21730 [Nocardiopsis ansamitocini]
MDDLLVPAQVLTLLAAVLSLFPLNRAIKARRLRTDLLQTPHLPIGSLATACSREGTIPVVVDGNAEPGPQGILHAPQSGRACVWYRVEVWSHRPKNGHPGNRIHVTRTTVRQSSRSFALRDRTGEVACRPGRAEPRLTGSIHQEFVPDPGRVPDAPRHLGPRDPERTETSLEPGKSYRERAVSPGARLLVRGHARIDGETVVLEGTDEEPLFFSTLSEPHLLEANQRREIVGFTLLPATLVVLAALAVGGQE